MLKSTTLAPKSLVFNLSMGLLFAATCYFALLRYNTMDCQTLHLTVYSGGILTLLRILAANCLALSLGLPVILAAIISGVLTTPLTGAALTSAAVTIVMSIFFLVSRFLSAESKLVRSLRGLNLITQDIDDPQDHKPSSAVEWVAGQIIKQRVPMALFASYCGALIRHLSLASFLAGGFIATAAVIISYSFAGSFVGCAIIDHQLDLPIERYRVPLVLSCILVFIIHRLRPRFSA